MTGGDSYSTDISPTSHRHPPDICRHADNQKSGQAAFEGAEGKGKTFPLEVQLDDRMRGATRACALRTL